MSWHLLCHFHNIFYIIVSPPRWYKGYLFSKKVFHCGDKLLGQIYGGGSVLHGGTNGHIMPGEGASFTNAFPSNLNTVNLKIFPNHVGWKSVLKIKPCQYIELWKDLSLWLTVKKFQRLCHVQFPSCWAWHHKYRGLNLTQAHYASRVGYFMQSLSSFLISLVVTFTLMLDYRTLLDLSSYGSDSWKRYTLKGICWCSEGELGSYFGLGESE